MMRALAIRSGTAASPMQKWPLFDQKGGLFMQKGAVPHAKKRSERSIFPQYRPPIRIDSKHQIHICCPIPGLKYRYDVGIQTERAVSRDLISIYRFDVAPQLKKNEPPRSRFSGSLFNIKIPLYGLALRDYIGFGAVRRLFGGGVSSARLAATSNLYIDLSGLELASGGRS